MAANHVPSYYAATANAFASQPALAGDTTTDVVVVGGGFAGLSAALHAAEAGFSVILIEANRIGWGASGRNGGQMIPGLRWGLLDLIAQFGEQHGCELMRVALEAAAAVRSRIARHAIACDQREGHFHAACKPAHLDAMKREHEALATRLDYPHGRIVEKADVRAIVAGGNYQGGYFDSNGGHLHPLNYALGLAKAALGAGVRIHEATPALAIDHGSPVRVKTPRGSITARHAILACDTQMASVNRTIARGIMPIANYNIATAPLGEDTARALIPSGAAVSDSRFVLNYYRLSADHRLIFGGGEKYSPRAPADIPGFVRPFMEAVFPQIKGVAIDYGWGGMVGVTMDRLPHFGRVGNAFFAHGWSGHGVLITTLAGELIAQAMRGTAERFDLFARLPHRNFPGGALLRHPLHVAGMLWFALRDRL